MSKPNQTFDATVRDEYQNKNELRQKALRTPPPAPDAWKKRLFDSWEKVTSEALFAHPVEALDVSMVVRRDFGAKNPTYVWLVYVDQKVWFGGMVEALGEDGKKASEADCKAAKFEACNRAESHFPWDLVEVTEARLKKEAEKARKKARKAA